MWRRGWIGRHLLFAHLVALCGSSAAQDLVPSTAVLTSPAVSCAPTSTHTITVYPSGRERSDSSDPTTTAAQAASSDQVFPILTSTAPTTTTSLKPPGSTTAPSKPETSNSSNSDPGAAPDSAMQKAMTAAAVFGITAAVCVFLALCTLMAVVYRRQRRLKARSASLGRDVGGDDGRDGDGDEVLASLKCPPSDGMEVADAEAGVRMGQGRTVTLRRVIVPGRLRALKAEVLEEEKGAEVQGEGRLHMLSIPTQQDRAKGINFSRPRAA